MCLLIFLRLYFAHIFTLFMEKYSQFRDPLTGIHPFTNPKYRVIRLSDIPIFLFRLAMLPFLLFFPYLLKYYIKITKPKKQIVTGTYICNRSSLFDKIILSLLYKDAKFYYVTKDDFVYKNKHFRRLDKSKLNIVFPEECMSNNSCIMKFVRNIEFDGIIGLKYSSSCIYMYGNIYKFLFRFLASKNTLVISSEEPMM